MNAARPIAVTVGEPAGIGPEVTVAALASKEAALAGSEFLLVGPRETYAQAARVLEEAGHDLSRYHRRLREGRVRFESVRLSGKARPGKPAVEDEVAVVESIRRATTLALQGKVGAMVTAPIDKRALFHQGYPGWGHTELIAYFCGAPTPTMLLQSRPRPEVPLLRVVPLTVHLPLKEIFPKLTGSALSTRIRLVHRELSASLGRPVRMALAALNPHAGEGGELGREEVEVLAPMVAQLRREGLELRGPLSSDTVFVRAVAGDFDGVFTLYHDQATIPVKLYGFGHGVNWTLGLPIVRTSPDHGTAYDLAGTGRAHGSSMLDALQLAIELARARGSGRTKRSANEC